MNRIENWGLGLTMSAIIFIAVGYSTGFATISLPLVILVGIVLGEYYPFTALKLYS